MFVINLFSTRTTKASGIRIQEIFVEGIVDKLIRISFVKKNFELSKESNFILIKVTNNRKSIMVLSFYSFKIP